VLLPSEVVVEGEEEGRERGWRGRRRGVWIMDELSCIGDTCCDSGNELTHSPNLTSYNPSL
jgi:hypothetical protein